MEKSNDFSPFLFFLQKYYMGDFNSISVNDWETIVNTLEKENLSKDPNIKKGLTCIKNATKNEYETMKYDFNKLFVGPDRLKAPPYESCYLNSSKVLMQKETLNVRQAYLEAGLKIINKNVEPDDFLPYELEFLLFLISKEDEKSKEMFKKFVDQHLSLWYKQHITDICENSTNSIIVGSANILEGTLNLLKNIA